MCIHVYVYVCIYIYIERERETNRFDAKSFGRCDLFEVCDNVYCCLVLFSKDFNHRVYIHMCVYIYTYIYIYIHMHTVKQQCSSTCKANHHRCMEQPLAELTACMYIYIYIHTHIVYIYIYMNLSLYIYVYIYIYICFIHLFKRPRITVPQKGYTRSPLEDSRLFGPSPWKILAATNEKNISEQPSPWRKSCERESCYGDRV